MQKNTYIICGIDPGNNTGVCFMEVDINTNEIVDISAHTLTTMTRYNQQLHKEVERQLDLDAPEKLKMITYLLNAKINEKNPSTFALEGAFYDRRRPMAFGPLLLTIDSFKKAIRFSNPNKEISVYQPLSVKAVLSQSSGLGKKPRGVESKVWVYKCVDATEELISNIDRPLDDLTEHAIDAIGIAYTKLVKTRETYE